MILQNGVLYGKFYYASVYYQNGLHTLFDIVIKCKIMSHWPLSLQKQKITLIGNAHSSS